MTNVLILSGANNHDYKRTSPFFKKVLEDDGRFTAQIVDNVDEYLSDPKSLDNVDVILMDYNGPMWGDAAKANFVAAVERGVGLVAIHAANNWPVGFPELEKMLGVVWVEGSGHGYFHQFDIRIASPGHPFAQGLEPFKNWDELYHRLENTQKVPFTVIADAYSSPDQRGTGRREPMIIANTYGKGRIIHNLLGHVWPVAEGAEPTGHTSMIAVDNEPYKKLLIRSCLYVAGKEFTNV